jgi:hypothetical protein
MQKEKEYSDQSGASNSARWSAETVWGRATRRSLPGGERSAQVLGRPARRDPCERPLLSGSSKGAGRSIARGASTRHARWRPREKCSSMAHEDGRDEDAWLRREASTARTARTGTDSLRVVAIAGPNRVLFFLFCLERSALASTIEQIGSESRARI